MRKEQSSLGVEVSISKFRVSETLFKFGKRIRSYIPHLSLNGPLTEARDPIENFIYI